MPYSEGTDAIGYGVNVDVAATARSQYVNYKGDKSPDQPLASVGSALMGAEDLANRVQKVVERLVGSIPKSVSAGENIDPQSTVQMPPVFRGLQRRAEVVQRTMNEAHAALDRLESMLP
jgi:hypothetical protein